MLKSAEAVVTGKAVFVLVQQMSPTVLHCEFLWLDSKCPTRVKLPELGITVEIPKWCVNKAGRFNIPDIELAIVG